MASDDKVLPLRDIMGNYMYPMSVDSNGVDIKTTVNNLKSSLDDINTSITDIDTNIENILTDYLDEIISNIDKRLSQIDGSDDILTNDGVMRLYVGPNDLYVNHNYTGTESLGTQAKPFSSFSQLTNYLKLYKTINAILHIHIETTGEYNESLELSGYNGGGYIELLFNSSGYLIVNGTREFGIKLSNISCGIYISNYRVFDTQHGILSYNCRLVDIANTVLSCNTTGVRVENTNTKISTVDFSNTYCAIDVHGALSNVYCVDCSGNCTAAFKVQGGSTLHYGVTTGTKPIPKGQLNQIEGRFFKHGTVAETSSWAYPNAGTKPTPSMSAKFIASYNFMGRGSFRLKDNTWWDTGCISGNYRDKGDSAGHIFFNLTEVRNFLNSGTVIDGATITMCRDNSRGTPQSVDIWVGGSSAANASGTPSYGSRAKVGQLAWGETKTFALNKSIVDGIKAGTYKSITTYGSGYCGINYAVIVLKVQT